MMTIIHIILLSIESFTSFKSKATLTFITLTFLPCLLVTTLDIGHFLKQRFGSVS